MLLNSIFLAMHLVKRVVTSYSNTYYFKNEPICWESTFHMNTIVNCPAQMIWFQEIFILTPLLDCMPIWLWLYCPNLVARCSYFEISADISQFDILNANLVQLNRHTMLTKFLFSVTVNHLHLRNCTLAPTYINWLLHSNPVMYIARFGQCM